MIRLQVCCTTCVLVNNFCDLESSSRLDSPFPNHPRTIFYQTTSNISLLDLSFLFYAQKPQTLPQPPYSILLANTIKTSGQRERKLDFHQPLQEKKLL
ncbi:unnamed protein product [Lactuca virosa]|uniref:Uncharacterized protein n=1 Tax=Lactuca virosa TaxID=75947 RepID=A0AAU9PI46_9ASTR|nr:unnamed protein product [Lactuca virosa]